MYHLPQRDTKAHLLSVNYTNYRSGYLERNRPNTVSHIFRASCHVVFVLFKNEIIKKKSSSMPEQEVMLCYHSVTIKCGYVKHLLIYVNIYAQFTYPCLCWTSIFWVCINVVWSSLRSRFVLLDYGSVPQLFTSLGCICPRSCFRILHSSCYHRPHLYQIGMLNQDI